MSTTHVARITSLDGPDGLRIEPEDLAPPGPGEVRLRMTALGLNRAEAMFARGQYLFQPTLPSRIGVEGVGVIAALGKGVTGLEVGQRTALFCAADMLNYGAAAEDVVVPATMLFPDVPAMTDAELAAFWMAYLTAYGGLVQVGELKAGETVLISAASSSVGLAAIELAKRLDARVVATTRGPEKKARLEEAGADRVIVTNDESLAAANENYDVVFDAVAGPFVGEAGNQMKRGGRIVVYGLLSGSPETPFPLFPALSQDIRMRAYHLGFFTLADEARRTDAFRWIEEASSARPFSPTIDRTFVFQDLADAYRHLEASNQFGKVVVKVSGAS